MMAGFGAIVQRKQGGGDRPAPRLGADRTKREDFMTTYWTSADFTVINNYLC